jgi:hypothetical protein
MSGLDIPHLRLCNQQIAHQTLRTPAEVVSHLGAMQAQDFPGAKWAIGLRLPTSTEADIERAIAERTIVRTWPMRRTLHFVAADDVRWILALTGARADVGFAPRYRQLGLDEHIFGLAKDVLVKALSGGRSLKRQALYELLEEAGIGLEGTSRLDSGQTRGLHILSHHAMTGLICYGSHQGKQPAFVLLDEWVPKSRVLDREESLGELAKCYFTSHGPATVQDFVWWSGLTLQEARAGIEMSRGHLVEEVVEGVAYWLPRDSRPPSPAPARHLLPPFDEYTVAYKDRSAVLTPGHATLAASGGVFRPIIVVDGLVVGTWKVNVKKGAIAVIQTPFDQHEWNGDALLDAARRYADFLGRPLVE